MKNKIKHKTKKLLKQQNKIRIITKRTKNFTCKRYKYSIKFENNIKFHEHICIRYVKKSKIFAQISKSKFVSQQLMSFIFFISLLFRLIISSFFILSKFLFFSIFISKIVRERSKNVLSNSIIELLIIYFLKFSSIAILKKSIF